MQKEKKELLFKRKAREKVVSKLKVLKNLWDKYKIDKVYLYGSFIDLTFYGRSDIDIALEGKITQKELYGLFAELSRCLKIEVDLRLLSELPFADKIKKEGIIIYERENINT